MIMLHKPSDVQDGAMRAIIHDCMRGHLDHLGQPQSPTWDENLFQTWKERHWSSRSLNFSLPGKSRQQRGREEARQSRQFNISLEMPSRLDLSNGRKKFEPPEQMRGSRHWLYVKVNSADVLHTDQAEMAWFLEKARCPLELLEPDFAFGDIDTTLFTNLDPEPWKRAWPLMILGPERVKSIGRDRLLDAPAWKVEELPYGGVWVQVWENPFDTPRSQVRALAEYLGLEARR